MLPLVGLSGPHLALSWDRLAAPVLALADQCSRCALCPPATHLGDASLPGASPRGSSRRRLLGPQTDCLDSHHPWRSCRPPLEPQSQKRRDGLPPTWTAEELGKRSSIERFFGRTFLFFRVPRPPISGWSAVATQAALTYAALWVIALAAWQAGRPELIRSPCLVLAHVWEGIE